MNMDAKILNKIPANRIQQTESNNTLNESYIIMLISGHPYLVPDLRGKMFSFSPLRIRFAVGFSYGLYYVEVDSFSAPFL